eukprot:5286089-Pleurochrysis_carterae.AAC.1
MFIISRTTPSMALRPSSKLLVVAWCAHAGSAAASLSPRTRRADCALRRPGHSSSTLGQSRECAALWSS